MRAPLHPALTDHLDWLRLRGMRPATLTSRRRAVHRLTRALPVDLLAATPDDLDRWQRALHLSDVSRSNEVANITGFYAWAAQAGLIETPPTALLIRPKLPKRLPRPIPEPDLALAIAGAPARIRPWLILAAYAGLRAGEIAQLERDAVQDQSNPPTIIVVDGKGGRQRIVPAADVVIAELRRYGMPSRGPVFPRADGRRGPNTPAHLSHLANEYLHGAGIAATLHQLRHRFGTEMYRVSVDLRMVQDCMGHSSPATTAGYVAWSHAKAAAAVNALA